MCSAVWPVPAPTKQRPVPSCRRACKAHGISMIFSLVFHELGLLLNDEAILAAGLAHAEEVMTAFLRPEEGLVYEFVTLDNEPNRLPARPRHRSRARDRVDVVHDPHLPAMGNEARIARGAGGYPVPSPMAGTSATAASCSRATCRRRRRGGLFADSKLWWPHTEALYALLLAYDFDRRAVGARLVRAMCTTTPSAIIPSLSMANGRRSSTAKGAVYANGRFAGEGPLSTCRDR